MHRDGSYFLELKQELF